MNRSFYILLLLLSLHAHILGQTETFSNVPAISDTLPGIADGVCKWVDYDTDNDLDIFLCGSSGDSAVAAIFRNDGNDIFSFITTDIIPLNFADADWGDYDNDGDPDLILIGATQENNTLVPHSIIYRNDGNGVFTDINVDLPDVYRGSAAWGDMDNDGDSDLIISGAFHEDSTGMILSLCEIVRNDGDNIFSRTYIEIQGVYNSKLAWGDYDNDLDLDLLVSGYYYDNFGWGHRYIAIYNNKGEEQFAEIDPGFPALQYADVAWADYDNDNDLDVVLNGDPDTPTILAYIFKNNGDATFQDIGIEILGTIHGTVIWGDFDNDGDFDFLQTGYLEFPSPTLETNLYRNFGSDMFTVDGSAVFPGVFKSSADWGDFDHDGDLDLILSGYSGIDESNPVTQVYRNNSDNSNTPPSPPAGLNSSTVGGQAELSWDPSFDNQSGHNGLSYNLKIGTVSNGSDVCSPMADINGYRQVAGMGNTNTNTAWILKDLQEGTYYWSVQAIDQCYEGSSFSEEQVFEVSSVGLAEGVSAGLKPKAHCFPNPFANQTTLVIELDQAEHIFIDLMNIHGNTIRNICDRVFQAGEHHIPLSMEEFEEGIYLLRIRSKDHQSLIKLVSGISR